MDWESEFVTIIKRDFAAKREKNLRFSLRAYAKKLGISAGVLSRLLSGNKKWKISPGRATKMLASLELKSSIRNSMLVKMGQPPQHQKTVLLSTQEKVLSQWYYVPVLIYFDLPEQYRSKKAIAQKLRLSEARVTQAIEDLIEMGLLKRTASGEIQKSDELMTTKDGVPDEALRWFHEVNLRLFQKMVKNQNVHQRDFTSFTFAGSKKKIDFLRAEIRNLYEKAESIMNDENDNDTVYRVSVQLAPLEFT